MYRRRGQEFDAIGFDQIEGGKSQPQLIGLARVMQNFVGRLGAAVFWYSVKVRRDAGYFVNDAN